jgi:hypothetical protein
MLLRVGRRLRRRSRVGFRVLEREREREVPCVVPYLFCFTEKERE